MVHLHAYLILQAIAAVFVVASVTMKGMVRLRVSGIISNVFDFVAAALSLSIVGLACCLTFVGVLVARVVLAVLIAAGMPVLAAGSVLGGGPLRIAGTWAVAVVAFDPLAALVYRVGHAVTMRADEPVVVLMVAK